jgi:hypothetical protein
MTPEFRRAVMWFHAHGAGTVGRSMIGALHLARAEAHAARMGWRFEWTADDSGDLGDHEEWCGRARMAAHADSRAECCHRTGLDGWISHEDWCTRARRTTHQGCEHEILGCILKTRDDAHAASLWGIIDADRDYGRMVQAELALEVLGAEEDRTKEDQRARGYMAL